MSSRLICVMLRIELSSCAPHTPRGELLLDFLRPLKPRFDYLIDELDPLLIRNKRALHCVQREFLEIMESQVKGVGGQFILPRESRFAHEPVIRIERDSEAIAMKNSERVFLDTL